MKVFNLITLVSLLFASACTYPDPNITQGGVDELKSLELDRVLSTSDKKFEDLVYIPIYSDIYSEEAWNLSKTLPLLNILFLMLLSVFFLGLYVYQGIFSANVKSRLITFISRIFIDYGLTLLVVIVILLALDKIPFHAPLIAFKRIVLIAFPASLVGVILDGMDKE